MVTRKSAKQIPEYTYDNDPLDALSAYEETFQRVKLTELLLENLHRHQVTPGEEGYKTALLTLFKELNEYLTEKKTETLKTANLEVNEEFAKPVILIREEGSEAVPFDLAGLQALPYPPLSQEGNAGREAFNAALIAAVRQKIGDNQNNKEE